MSLGHKIIRVCFLLLLMAGGEEGAFRVPQEFYRLCITWSKPFIIKALGLTKAFVTARMEQHCPVALYFFREVKPYRKNSTYRGKKSTSCSKNLTSCSDNSTYRGDKTLCFFYDLRGAQKYIGHFSKNMEPLTNESSMFFGKSSTFSVTKAFITLITFTTKVLYVTMQTGKNFFTPVSGRQIQDIG
jgi:hypothetical protein